MILSHKRPMVKLNRRELDHFRLEGDPGYYVLQRVNDETRSGTVLIARAMLQGREFEIVNHNGGGNPSYVVAEFCVPCDGDECEFCGGSGYHRKQPRIDPEARKRWLIGSLRPKGEVA